MFKIRRVFQLLIFAGGLATLANCSSGSSDNSAAASTSYYMANGICYQSGTNTPVATTSCSTGAYQYVNGVCYGSGVPVASTYCSSSITSGYSLVNGYCYVTGTSQIVSNQYCYATTTGYTAASGYASTQVCYGTYFQFTGYTYVPVGCYGSICRGQTLYTQYGQPVLCQ